MARWQQVLRYIRRLGTAEPGTPRTDQELLEAFARRGEQQAFAELVERHGGLVWGVCRRILGNDADAEDACQATFIVLLRKAESLANRGLVAGWLYTVASHAALRLRGKQARIRRQEQEAAAMNREATEPPLPDDWQDLLDEELRRLPDAQREPLMLCCLQGRTQDEAARMLGWSLSTVKRRLDEGRERLRDRLSRQGIAFPAALTALTLAQQQASAAPEGLMTELSQLGSSQAGAVLPGITSRAELLADALLQAMRLQRLKLIAAAALLVALISAGSGLAYRWLQPDIVTPTALLPVVVAPSAPTDLYGDELPAGAIGRLGTRRFWVGKDGAALAFTPDGKQVLAAGFEVKSFDVASGKPSLLFDKLPAGVTRVAFAPDGKLAAVACVARYARDGKAVAGGRLALFEVGSGKLIHELSPLTAESPIFVTFAFSPDGTRLAAANNRHELQLYDVPTGKELPAVTLSNLPASPFGLRRHFESRPVWVSDLGFAPSGKLLVTAGPDACVRVFDAAGKLRHTIDTVQPELAAFTADEKALLTFSTDSTIRRWELADGREVQAARVRVPYKYKIASRSPDGRLLVLLDDYQAPARLIDFETGTLRGECTGANGNCQAAFSPDGRLLATTSDFEFHVRLWDTATGKQLEPRPSHTRVVTGAAFAPDGSTIATTSENAERIVRIWDAASTRELHRISLQVGTQSLCYTPDGKHLIVGEPGRSFGMWDVATGRLARRFDCEFGGFRWLDVSPDGSTIAYGGGDQPIRFLDAATGKLHKLQLPASQWRSLKYSAAGERLLAFSEKLGEAHVFDLPAGNLLRAVPRSSRSVAVDLSRDGSLLAVVNQRDTETTPEQLVCIHDVASGVELFSLPARMGGVGSLAFSPDGKLIAAGSRDGPVRVWNLATGQEVFDFTGHGGFVNHLAFTSDGKKLASCAQDSSVLIWDVSTPIR